MDPNAAWKKMKYALCDNNLFTLGEVFFPGVFKKGLPIDFYSKQEDSTPLRLACQIGAIDAVKLMLEKGANPNVNDSDGQSPLHVVCLSGQHEKIKVLLDHGALIDAQNHQGETPLLASMRKLASDHHSRGVMGIQWCLGVLAKKGADFSIADNQGVSPAQFVVHVENRHKNSTGDEDEGGFDFDDQTKRFAHAALDKAALQSAMKPYESDPSPPKRSLF